MMYPLRQTFNPSRIVGGQEAPEMYAPFQCLIQTSDVSILCSGSIISNEFILTAAHCLHENKICNYGISFVDDVSRYFLIGIRQITGLRANDIGLIRVKGSIKFNNRVRSIDLLRGEVADFTDLELTGWGRLSANGDDPTKLQLITLKTYPLKECKKRWSGQEILTARQICTFTKSGEGSCKGDSGGPLVLRQGSNVQLVGIVSFGMPCADGYPDVYTKVSHYLNWIANNAT
ncbi:Chymotrypsin-2 [Pseudolycoriella hygida]|uniref:Chymotrypsin-2 n=1 Tax=Pseudolycoriella hygida TaxID=35572 RepID=A0A9Q0N8I8_9DIPT|nr:Chymotrypsin-2 [Pseudolycoriella hygida]